MKTSVTIRRKILAARSLIESCISPFGKGIWASRGRYANQLWTRDFVLAAAPALKLMGREDVIGAHLTELIKRQRPDGKIPVLFLDDIAAFLKAKIDRSIKEGKWSFMLKRYIESGGVEDLSPWTKDSEFLFAGAAGEYCLWEASEIDKKLQEAAITKALEYVERHLLVGERGTLGHGLVLGADWRDTNTWLDETALLSNNCLYYDALRTNGRGLEAIHLKGRINDHFWVEGAGYVDYLTPDGFHQDTLGQALGVIHDVIPPERYPFVLDSFTCLHTPRGYLSNDCRPNPTTPEERKLLHLKRMKQSFVIWPFIHGYAILALLKMGESELAEQAFTEYTRLNGFWEYYDPRTGKGYGAKEQLWSAALYFRTAAALGHDVTL